MEPYLQIKYAPAPPAQVRTPARACYSQITHAAGLRFHTVLIDSTREVRFERVVIG